MKVKSVEIEGFHNVEKKKYTFDNLNYIKGPNGAGKSTILQAIQLAVLGYIPGTNKNKESIFRHANGKTLAVSVVLDNNGEDLTISRIWTGTGSSISSVLDIQPKDKYDLTKIVSDMELPIFNFSDFLSLTANKQKDWFIEFLPELKVEIDWKKELESAISEKGVENVDKLENQILSEIETIKSDDTDMIRKVNTYLKGLLSASKAEANRLQGTIQSYIYYEDVEDIDEDSVRNNITNLTSLKSTRMEYDAAIQKNEHTDEELKKYSDLSEDSSKDTRFGYLDESISDHQNNLADLEEKLQSIRKRKLEIQNDLYQIKNILRSDGICPITNRNCSTLLDTFENNKAEEKRLSIEFDDLNGHDLRIHDSKTKIQAEITRLTKEKSDLIYSYNMRDTLVRSKVTVPELTDNRTVEELNEDIKSEYDVLSKVQANAQYETMIDKITKDKFVVENEIEALKVWIKLTDVNGLQSTASSGDVFDPLKEHMDVYISKLFGRRTKTKFNSTGKANSFSFGIDRNKTYIPYDLLSSGEKCKYTLALMLSLVDMSDCALKLIMVDDMFDHLDNDNVASLYKVLQKIDNIQMIFAGVKDIKDGGNIIKVK